MSNESKVETQEFKVVKVENEEVKAKIDETKKLPELGIHSEKIDRVEIHEFFKTLEDCFNHKPILTIFTDGIFQSEQSKKKLPFSIFIVK